MAVFDYLEGFYNPRRRHGAGAAGGLGEHPVAAGGCEGVDLELGVLVGGGDAGVAEQVSHRRERRRTV